MRDHQRRKNNGTGAFAPKNKPPEDLPPVKCDGAGPYDVHGHYRPGWRLQDAITVAILVFVGAAAGFAIGLNWAIFLH